VDDELVMDAEFPFPALIGILSGILVNDDELGEHCCSIITRVPGKPLKAATELPKSRLEE
jgi:hypothetical protein